jgi:hypothetical protein
LRAGGRICAEERAAARRRRRWSSVVANSDLFGEAFSIDATEQLDGDVDIPISRARHNRRRKIVPLNHSQSVAAPAKPNTDVWLRPESHFIGVNSHEEKYIGLTAARATNSKGGGISARSRRRIARATRRIGRSYARTDGAVVGQHGGAARLVCVASRRSLCSSRSRADKNAPTPAHGSNVRF